MKKAFRKFLRIGLVTASLLMIVVVSAVLFFLFDKPLVKSLLISQLTKRTGMTIRAGELDYTLFPFRLTVRALELGWEDDFQKLALSCSRLGAAGNFRKIVRGAKPAIDTIEADGAVINFIQKAPAKKPLDYEAAAAQVTAGLAWARKATVKNARLTVSVLSLEASLENIGLALTTEDGKTEASFSVGPSPLDIRAKNGAFSLRTGLSASGSLRLASSLGFEAAVDLDSPRFAAAGIEGSPARISIESAGRIDPAAKEISVSRIKIRVPDLLDFEGTAGGSFDRNFFLDAKAEARLEKIEDLAALLRPVLPMEFRQARIRGAAVLSGKYQARRSGRETSDSLDTSLTFEGVEIGTIYERLPLRALASGKIQASGPSNAPRFTADIRSSVGGIALDRLRVGGADVHVVASAGRQGVDISKFEAGLKNISFDPVRGKRLAFDNAVLKARADLYLGPKNPGRNSLEARFDATIKNLFLAAAEGKTLSSDTVTLKGNLGLDPSRKTLTVASLETQFPGIAPLFISGRYAWAKMPAAEARLETRGLDIPALRPLAAPFLPKSWAGWDLAGTADLSLKAQWPSAAELDWGLSGEVALAGVSLNDPDFTIACEEINPRLNFEAGYDAKEGLSFKGGLNISQGESLWKAVYVSWSRNPLQVTVSGRLLPGSGGLDDLSARFHLPAVGEISLSGSAQLRPSLSFDLSSDARLSLGPAYSLYAQAGVTAENRINLEGTLRAGLHLKKEAEALSVTGKLTLTDTNFEHPSTHTAILGVEAEVPVHYEPRKETADSPETSFPEPGFLRIGEFRNRLLDLKSLDISLRSGANAYSTEPLSLDLYGGRVQLGRMTFQIDPKSGSLQGAGSLTLQGLDISLFPIPSPQFKLTGTVRADFPRLDISPRRIAVSGRGEADLFGGQVILRDLQVSNPFTRGRSISLNIDLLDLDLEKLTREVPFGEVTGIVSGEVRDLVFTYGQPERFEFRLESVPRKGVRQTFSLRAVDSLTVLSSGAQATAGTSRFWMRFVRGFRYAKLGIVSTLRNDTFTLNGTIHEGGVEYLVKRSPLFGISVVNRMPRYVISFKEMVSRLKRVGRSEK
jgi:hypothetical protein